MSRQFRRAAEPLTSLLSSLRRTGTELAGAIRTRSGKKIIALLSEGSPLESSIEEILGLAFRAALIAPVILVPAYYLILTLV